MLALRSAGRRQLCIVKQWQAERVDCLVTIFLAPQSYKAACTTRHRKQHTRLAFRPGSPCCFTLQYSGSCCQDTGEACLCLATTKMLAAKPQLSRA